MGFGDRTGRNEPTAVVVQKRVICYFNGHGQTALFSRTPAIVNKINRNQEKGHEMARTAAALLAQAVQSQCQLTREGEMKVPKQPQPRRWAVLGGAVALVILVSGTGAFAQSDQIEPNAGTWKTWVISSGEDLRVPPPPDAAATAAELAQMRDLMAQADPAAADAITFWDAGSPAYRWIDLAQPPPARGPADTVFTPHLHLSDDGDVRRHHRRVGVEVLLQSAASERNGSDAGGRPAHAAESLLSVRACCDRRSRGHGSVLLLSG